MPTKKAPVTDVAVPKKTTPKAATKAAPKKVAKTAGKAPSKAAPKTNTKKPLVYADTNTSFWVADGQILNSLVALRDALTKMEKSFYNQHVSAQKNDFANWVAAVLGDAACAKELKSAKTPTAAKAIVVLALKNYKL